MVRHELRSLCLESRDFGELFDALLPREEFPVDLPRRKARNLLLFAEVSLVVGTFPVALHVRQVLFGCLAAESLLLAVAVRAPERPVHGGPHLLQMLPEGQCLGGGGLCDDGREIEDVGFVLNGEADGACERLLALLLSLQRSTQLLCFPGLEQLFVGRVFHHLVPDLHLARLLHSLDELVVGHSVGRRVRRPRVGHSHVGLLPPAHDLVDAFLVKDDIYKRRILCDLFDGLPF
mmetsp:Transcript_37364/g.75697  ORF Transcript_37364/g.75697 Transcript_37364/m.75697 type:complete len:234 (-) Transcript_37364:291-992(-)